MYFSIDVPISNFIFLDENIGGAKNNKRILVLRRYVRSSLRWRREARRTPALRFDEVSRDPR